MKIPKSTTTFKYYNANQKNKKTSDCVCRAISTALNQDYKQTMMELVELSLKTGYEYTDKRCYGKYLELKGWCQNAQPRKADNTKYTGKEFVKIFKDICIAHIGSHHIVCIKEGKIWDIWDSTNGCVGNYWTKQI